MNSPNRLRAWVRRIILFLFSAAALVAVAGFLWASYCFRDRHPRYQLALAIDGQRANADPRPLRVGFGREKITPSLSSPERPVWLAGFSNGRAATAIHDDLWAVACAIDDGHTRLGIVALDAIGFFHDDVITVRRQLGSDLKLDYTIICSLHNHSTPDLMGMWGKNILHTGVDPQYKHLVERAAANALGQAVTALQPARLALHEIPTPTAGLVADTRKPEIFDPNIRLMVFANPTNNLIIGSIVGWADHPETPWGHNTEVTADYPGVLREALAKGIVANDRVQMPGLGGIHLYVNGAIGGLMTTHPSTTVHDPFLNQDFSKPSHEKSRAVGHQLAQRILQHLAAHEQGRGAAACPAATDSAPISIRARTIELPVDNVNFLLAPLLGVLDRGQVRWKTIRSEVGLVTIGDASIACIPGELYPEIANGGIVHAPGGDFDIDPVEVPPIRDLMPGKVKFLFGLANDEIGYIIPKSEWDEKPPYLFNAEKPVYGEINSLGPNTAPLLHRAIRELCANRHRNHSVCQQSARSADAPSLGQLVTGFQCR
jgi:hypothetical protein